ncbi:MAG TPA: DUF4270 family protein [Bacteroidales bacterium]|nr:DUF4270 family protein [Bacteroidales bacterium]
MLKIPLQAMAILMVVALIFSGCDIDPDKIGVDLQPEADKLNIFYTDTVTVLAHTIRVDSVRTDKTLRTMLGSYNDPVFGTSSSAMALQLRLSSTAVELGTSPVLDSIVLSMDYTIVPMGINRIMRAYGDTTTEQTWNVYELDQSIYADSIYYSSSQVALKSGEIATKTFAPHPTDSIVEDGVKSHARLRIKMDDSFVQKFRDADPADFASIEGFLQFFKGLYIQPEVVTQGGAILFFNVGSTTSRMTLYYKNEVEDSLRYFFPVTSLSGRFMNFTHDYQFAASELQSQLNGDTVPGQQQLFVQAMGGTAVMFEFPYIRNLTLDGNLALNQAKLVFTNSVDASPFMEPTEFLLYNVGRDGSYRLLEDQTEGAEYFGGRYDPKSHQLSFRITQQMQKILTQDTLATRFYLGASSGSILPNRVVLNGFDPPQNVENQERLKLELIFTRLK